MSDALRVNIYSQQGKSALVRGLPKIVMQRIGFPQRWNSEQHAWVLSEREVPDLCAMLENEGITPNTHDKPAPPWTAPPAEVSVEIARQGTDELKGLAGHRMRIDQRMIHLSIEAVKNRWWAVLGYDSLEAYCQAELPYMLTKEVRREVVHAAINAGLSVRAAGTIARTSKDTALRDARLMPGVSNATPEPVTAEPQEVRRIGSDAKSYPVRDRPPQRTYEPVEPLVGEVVHMHQYRDEGCVDDVIVLLQGETSPRRFVDLERAVALHRQSIEAGVRSLR